MALILRSLVQLKKKNLLLRIQLSDRALVYIACARPWGQAQQKTKKENSGLK
jgi:hypothetical protein